MHWSVMWVTKSLFPGLWAPISVHLFVARLMTVLGDIVKVVTMMTTCSLRAMEESKTKELSVYFTL